MADWLTLSRLNLRDASVGELIGGRNLRASESLTSGRRVEVIPRHIRGSSNGRIAGGKLADSSSNLQPRAMSQVIKIPVWKTERKKEEMDFTVPTETLYFFRTGSRFALKLVPIWTRWQVERENKPEEVWKFHCVLVYMSFQNKIEAIEIQVSQIPGILEANERSSGPRSTAYEILDLLQDYPQGNRDAAQFKADYNGVMSRIANKQAW